MYDQSGVLFCTGILHDHKGISDRKRVRGSVFYSKKMHADKPAVVIELKWENPHREPLRRSKTGTIQMP